MPDSVMTIVVRGTPVAQPRDTPSVILPEISQLGTAPKYAKALWHWLRKNCHAGTRGVPLEHPVHAWKKIVAADAKLVRRNAKMPLLESAIRVDLVFAIPRPKSKTLKTKPNKRYWLNQKPDYDNLTKAVVDALNEVIWFDDAQIVIGETASFVCGDGDQPGVVIRVQQAPDEIITWADEEIRVGQFQEEFF